MNFCSQCGTKLVASWNVCPNCGYSLKLDRGYQQPAQFQPPVQIYTQQKTQYRPYNYRPRSNNTYGTAALIFGLLGLFGVIPIVGSIISIVLGAVGKNSDDDPRTAKAGLVLGIIGIVVWIVIYVSFFLSILMMLRSL